MGPIRFSYAAGKTLTEAADSMTAQLLKFYRKPEVLVNVRMTTSRYATVLGHL